MCRQTDVQGDQPSGFTKRQRPIGATQARPRRQPGGQTGTYVARHHKTEQPPCAQKLHVCPTNLCCQICPVENVIAAGSVTLFFFLRRPGRNRVHVPSPDHGRLGQQKHSGHLNQVLLGLNRTRNRFNDAGVLQDQRFWWKI